MNDEPRQSSYADSPDTTALLTVREAYLRLRISKWKLYDLIRSNLLKTVRIGRRRLIPIAALQSYLERRARESLD